MKNPCRVIWAIVLCAASYAVTLGVGSVKVFGEWLGPDSWIAGSVFTHLAMLILSLVLIRVMSGGDFGAYGFKGVSVRVIPKAILAGAVTVIAASMIPTMLMVMIGGRGILGEGMGPTKGMTALQMFTSILILASIAEEVLYRGLIQSFLAPLGTHGIQLLRVRLSLPVILAGAAFGMSHLILIGNTPGPLVAVIVFATTVLGIVAGYYREKTGSLVPAIVIHMMFNVAGVLGKLAQSSIGS
ncbi:MAG: CPBP family intramembrane metalloprotease [Candidatus Eisenbacteria sp.]|nr:CPBP family intramembrane metalloprotease [Candidatus Eisenbacteria bacterium]